MPTRQLLSIVIPCYNEEEVLAETIARLLALCQELESPGDLEVELIFVDDGSRDNTFVMLKDFARRDQRIKVISFSRNFGHQLAVSAGMDAARGDAVVLIDADLQDPPELILQMIEQWRGGRFDVVYATRKERKGESFFKIFSARLFYRLLNLLSDVPVPLDTGDFRLMSRKVVEVLKNMPERYRFVRGMVSWVGFRQTSILYDREDRLAGISKYPLKKMVQFALDGVLSFSIKPLQLSVLLGLFSALIALLTIVYAIFLRLFTSVWVEGWTALMIAILFVGGVQMISIGILGEYVGRIYNEVKRRPLYVVRESFGFAQAPPSPAAGHDSLDKG